MEKCATLLTPQAPVPHAYQLAITQRAIRENILVVLPTGLGKTYIALLTALHFLDQYGSATKIILLAPTRPLVLQHLETFQSFILQAEHLCIDLTGKTDPSQRQTYFQSPSLIFYFMTPQTLHNDLKNRLYDLSHVSLLILDEAHHAMGDYAYCPIVQMYNDQNMNGRILGLTASPGSTHTKLKELLTNLTIPRENIEYRDRTNADVQPYSHPIEFEYIGVDMTPLMKQIYTHLTEVRDQTVQQYIQQALLLDPLAIADPARYTQTYCASQIKTLTGILTQQPSSSIIKALLSINARLMKLHHLISNLEAQGLENVAHFLNKLMKKISTKKASIADHYLLKDPHIATVISLLQNALPENLVHPKLIKLYSLLAGQLDQHPSSRILIFTKYRDTVNIILHHLKSLESCRAVKFVGQATKEEDKGLNQKEQIAILDAFRANEVNVLVATSVAEEGLDIAECNLVVFYDNSASEMSLIQRSGRTGRKSKGNVIILYTKGTTDQRFLEVAQAKQRRMTTRFNGKTSPRTNMVSQNTIIPHAEPPSKKVSLDPFLLKKSNQAKCTIGFLPLITKRYQLESIVPPHSQIESSDGYHIIVSSPESEIKMGFDILLPDQVQFSPANFLFIQQLRQKVKRISYYHIFLDVSTCDSALRSTIQSLLPQMKQQLGVAISLFDSIDQLHVTLRMIFQKYIKSLDEEDR